MKREIRIFLTAMMFYTRIPAPHWVDHSEEFVKESIRYFPLIGWIVGGIVASVYLVGSYLFSPLTGITLSLIASVLTTGAFHEDGFADASDGFGGGWTKPRILAIMKDSLIGVYGVVGLILLLGLKISLLYEAAVFMDQQVVIVFLMFISAHALSRFIASTFVFTHRYVRDSPESKAKSVAKQSDLTNLFIGSIWGFLPLIAFSIYGNLYSLLAIIFPLYLLKMLLGKYFRKWIGGYTGDCLGATQQITETAHYLFLLLIWKFT